MAPFAYLPPPALLTHVIDSKRQPEDRVRLTGAPNRFHFFFSPKSKTLSLKMTDDLTGHHDYLLKTGNFSRPREIRTVGERETWPTF